MKGFKVFAFEANEACRFFKGDGFSSLETAPGSFSAQGWDVVSVCPNHCMANVHGNFLVTPQRETP